MISLTSSVTWILCYCVWIVYVVNKYMLLQVDLLIPTCPTYKTILKFSYNTWSVVTCKWLCRQDRTGCINVLRILGISYINRSSAKHDLANKEFAISISKILRNVSVLCPCFRWQGWACFYHSQWCKRLLLAKGATSRFSQEEIKALYPPPDFPFKYWGTLNGVPQPRSRKHMCICVIDVNGSLNLEVNPCEQEGKTGVID